ncbi:MAG: DUF2950 domain-containing protein [Hyphomicrobiales bacterium]|nr:DUF2950 domain-containing protein [Hyphomicrobiales bacterium]
MTSASELRSHSPRSVRTCGRVAMTLAFVLATTCAWAQERFKSPDDAVAALINAAKATDRAAVTRVLGPGSAEIVSSGDPVADANARKRVLEAYDNKHQVVMEGQDKAVLVVGNEEWPFPIPIVRKDGSWHFDSVAGREEVLARRIGRNELNTIEAALAFVDAQQEYAEKGIAGSGVYAQRIVSQSGKKDGLYWPAASGEDESPLGDLMASATAEGYRAGQQRIPYHGYYYRVLTRQGASAAGGALDYVVRGKMIGGFALVAYPAEYGNSGVMTFIVNHQGVVYQKDLGPNTARIASAMTSFNPDQSWSRVAVQQP